jgi:hypothetical protein
MSKKTLSINVLAIPIINYDHNTIENCCNKIIEVLKLK